MKSIATIKIKIPKKEFLTDIIKEYSKCIQYISNKGFNSKTHNRYKLHNFVYYDCSYHLNADLNASFNLKFLGKVLTTKADVNQLYIPNVDSKAIFSGIADDFRDNQYPKSVMPLASA